MSVSTSAPAAKPAGGPLQIIVVPSGDFTIQLTPAATPPAEKPANTVPKRARTVQFRVSRAVLREHSSFFETILNSHPNMVRIATL